MILIGVAVAVLVQEPPQDMNVWLATLSALAAAGFIIWRLNIPMLYSGMDIIHLKVHIAGNAVMLTTCVVAACVCVVALPSGPALATSMGFLCAAALLIIRFWLVAVARRRFTVWRR